MGFFYLFIVPSWKTKIFFDKYQILSRKSLWKNYLRLSWSKSKLFIWKCRNDHEIIGFAYEFLNTLCSEYFVRVHYLLYQQHRNLLFSGWLLVQLMVTRPDLATLQDVWNISWLELQVKMKSLSMRSQSLSPNEHISSYLFVAFIRKLLEDCCDPGHLFAMTKHNSPMGKNLWFDGEFLYSFTIDNATYSLFPKVSNILILFTSSLYSPLEDNTVKAKSVWLEDWL